VLLEDAIVSFDFIDEFHLWAGHLLVPVDRANASGPFFMIPWNYPGFFGGAVQAPREGPLGRNNGAVVWGDINGGQVTYLAGVFDNGLAAESSPLFSGRVRLALWDKEPGFWGNASYFGDKDLLSIGLGSQYQKQPGKDYTLVNADVLLEKKLGGGLKNLVDRKGRPCLRGLFAQINNGFAAGHGNASRGNAWESE